jgi:hypothetical protein
VKSVAMSFDRTDLHDLALIHVLTGSGWVAGRLGVEHPCNSLNRTVAEPT